MKNTNDEIISPKTLDKNDLIILKSYILRKKAFFTLIEKIYLEICKFSNVLNDEVFIKNTIPLSTNSSVSVFQFSWLPTEPKSFFKTNSIVNLSIL